jgi:predicted MFS family arabinose efflux permease
VLIGLVGLIVGLVGMVMAGDSRTAAILALLVFFAGFEFAFVSSLTLVTEAAPLARGRAIGISNACGTVARASAVFTSGQLYEAFGIAGSVALGITFATAGVFLTLATPTYIDGG